MGGVTYHQTPQDHHQHSVVLVHSLEQPVKSQHDEDHDGPGEEVADDAEVPQIGPKHIRTGNARRGNPPAAMRKPTPAWK